jgi:excisionase family DNA binding protein
MTMTETSAESEQFISVARAVQLTGLGLSTIRGYMASGRLQKYRVGDRRVALKRADVDALFTRGA